jgi:tetratricopeptide (TPR) repeat protein
MAARARRPHSTHAQAKAPRPAAGWTASGRALVLLAVLLFATFAAYRPAWHGAPLWDDDAHMTRSELRSVDGLGRIWFEPGATQQYYPLLHSTFWVLHRVCGDDTTGYHLVSIGLHALSAWLFAIALAGLRVPWPWLGALVFALHPVHVESVAWIAELKNTLSGFLFLAAALAYLRFDRARGAISWGAAFVLFVLALLTKTVTATLPVLLLVVVWWQRGRLDLRRDLRPLGPFVVVALAFGLFSVWAERALIGARGTGFDLSLVERVLVAGRAVWFYLWKLAWPFNLTFIYARWSIDTHAWWQYLFPLAWLALLSGLWRVRAVSRAPLAAALWFSLALAPALGFVNVYPFRFSFVADHFQYLASLGVIALAVGGLAILLPPPPETRRAVAVGAVVLVVLPLGWLTWRQSHDYVDAETLYRATIARSPTSWMAHNNLAVLKLPGAVDEAIHHLQQALRANPDYAEAHDNMGLALQMSGRFEDAVASHRAALRLEPTFAEAHNNLGTALQGLGRVDEAAAEFREAIRLRPHHPQAHVNLGHLLVQSGHPEEAVSHYRDALRVDGTLANVHYTLGAALELLGRSDEALAAYLETLRLEPASADAHGRLAAIYDAAGRLRDALPHYEAWVRLQPDSEEARLQLGSVLYRTDAFEPAAAAFEAAVRLAPDSVAARNNLGAALERLGRTDEAAAQYREAVRLAPDSAEAQANLARVQRR